MQIHCLPYSHLSENRPKSSTFFLQMALIRVIVPLTNQGRTKHSGKSGWGAPSPDTQSLYKTTSVTHTTPSPFFFMSKKSAEYTREATRPASGSPAGMLLANRAQLGVLTSCRQRVGAGTVTTAVSGTRGPGPVQASEEKLPPYNKRGTCTREILLFLHPSFLF